MAKVGGQLHAMADGSILVVVSEGDTPVDRSRQAARCGLVLHQFLPAAAVAMGAARGISGDTAGLTRAIDIAGAVLRSAKPGEVLVDPQSRPLLESRFQIHTPPGGAPRLLFEKDLNDSPRTILGAPTPFVGRRRELRKLHRNWEITTQDESACAVVITAEAGLGKSRLREEFTRQILDGTQETELFFSSGDPMRSGTPYGVLSMALRAVLGIKGGMSNDKLHRRLRRTVETLISDSGAQQQVFTFLAEIARAPLDNAAAEKYMPLKAARRDPQIMADQTLAAWSAYLEGLTATRPVLFVLEDLQWADAPSMALMDGALRLLTDKPLMVTGWARTELENEFPELWADRNTETIALRPLNDKESHRMVVDSLDAIEKHTGDVLIPPDGRQAQVDIIVGRAEGHPYFIEELLRTVAAGQSFDAQSALPETVLGMAQSRLDQLGGEPKRLLRAGSVYGLGFSRQGLRAVLGRTMSGDVLRSYLEFLVEEDVLRAEEHRGHRRFYFRHALLRDAAYAMLTPDDIQTGHRAAGLFLESHTPTADQNPMELVHHFEMGGERPRAAHHCSIATARAYQADDLHSAIACADKASALGLTGSALGQVRLTQARAYYWMDKLQGARASAAEAAERLSGPTPCWPKASWPTPLACWGTSNRPKPCWMR